MTDTRRTVEQNKLLWSLLDDISQQVVWYGEKLSSTQWKRAMMAGMPGGHGVVMVRNPHGPGYIDVGSSSSTLKVAEMAELLEIAIAFGEQHGVRWKLLPPPVISAEEYRRSA